MHNFYSKSIAILSSKTTPITAIGLWTVFVLYYAFAVKYHFHETLSDYGVFIIQFIFDCLIGLFSFKAMFNNTTKEDTLFYRIFFISVVPGLIANESYNILINIFKINILTSNLTFLWTIPYLAFLLIQLVAWAYLIKAKTKKIALPNKKVTLLLVGSYFQVGFVVLFSLFLSTSFRDLIKNGLFTLPVITTFMEVILFNVISIAFSKTKNKALSYLETGFLLLVSLNLAQRISYMSGYYYKTFDAIWMICLIIIISGFWLKKVNNNETIEFFENSSLHRIAGAVLSFFSTLIFSIFIILNIFLSSVDTASIKVEQIFYGNIPAVLVFLYTLSILFSKTIATYLSKPLEVISVTLERIQQKKLHINSLTEQHFSVYEIEKLYQFLIKTISQLESANQVKSEFIMNMSHDFRTPASGIYHMSKHIYEKMEEGTLKYRQKLVVDSSAQLIGFIDDILDYSQLYNDKMAEVKRNFNIRELIKDMIAFVSSKINEKGLTIESVFNNTIDWYIGDDIIINRIVLNIVSNAIKFTHHGGITLVVSEKQEKDTFNLIIKIIDTGIGMETHYTQLIFEPFFRIEPAEMGEYSGVGLGLSNVKLMLKKISGSIYVESVVNEGSIFVITLPIEPAKTEEE